MLKVEKYFNAVEKAIILSGDKKRGTQETLKRKLSEKGVPVAQSTISDWKKNGYVTQRYVDAVSEITGVPTQELIKKEA